MYEPTGEERCTARQKAHMRSEEPTSTAVMKERGGRLPAGGETLYPFLVMISATRRPPLRASPTICGPKNKPAYTTSVDPLKTH